MLGFLRSACIVIGSFFFVLPWFGIFSFSSARKQAKMSEEAKAKVRPQHKVKTGLDGMPKFDFNNFKKSFFRDRGSRSPRAMSISSAPGPLLPPLVSRDSGSPIPRLVSCVLDSPAPSLLHPGLLV